MTYLVAILSKRAVNIHFKQLRKVFPFLSNVDGYVKRRILSELINPKNLVPNYNAVMVFSVFNN